MLVSFCMEEWDKGGEGGGGNMREEWEVMVSTWNEKGSGADKVIVTT